MLSTPSAQPWARGDRAPSKGRQTGLHRSRGHGAHSPPAAPHPRPGSRRSAAGTSRPRGGHSSTHSLDLGTSRRRTTCWSWPQGCSRARASSGANACANTSRGRRRWRSDPHQLEQGDRQLREPRRTAAAQSADSVHPWHGMAQPTCANLRPSSHSPTRECVSGISLHPRAALPHAYHRRAGTDGRSHCE